MRTTEQKTVKRLKRLERRLRDLRSFLRAAFDCADEGANQGEQWGFSVVGILEAARGSAKEASQIIEKLCKVYDGDGANDRTPQPAA